MHGMARLFGVNIKGQGSLDTFANSLFSGADKLTEQRMGSVRPRFELRVVLGTDHKWVVGHFAGLNQVSVG